MAEKNPYDDLKAMRRDIIKAAYKAKEGHIPSAFSILEALYSIYDFYFSVNKPTEFQMILSKGHGALGLYAVLDRFGLIGKEWIGTFAQHESKFGGHPDSVKIAGVATSTGSLGHGLPIAVGKILANRIKSVEQSIYCLIGDGELNEGTMWESLLVAQNHKLNELVILVDNNHSSDRALDIGDLQLKFQAFGFFVIDCNGHDIEAIKRCIKINSSNAPKAIILNTIKGYGIVDMEHNPAWHHRVPNEVEFSNFMKELQ